ncbi:MAG: hypothetical protein GY941_19290 [Planctomycetes bacterium]|nr:hypothetical protein [Planctomycetota bacterium]
MYEFRVTIEMERDGIQVFIVNTDAENEAEAEDQIKYLINNKLEILSMEQIKLG